MLLTESEVYVGAKAFLQRTGWVILGGQPPDGSNHLPVVEIKEPSRTKLGSQGAYKPDLLAIRHSILLIVECKPDHSETDAAKLREILADEQRIRVLFKEIEQRRLLSRRGLGTPGAEARLGVRGALAHSGTPITQPDLLILLIKDPEGSGRIVAPSHSDELFQEALAAQ